MECTAETIITMRSAAATMVRGLLRCSIAGSPFCRGKAIKTITHAQSGVIQPYRKKSSPICTPATRNRKQAREIRTHVGPMAFTEALCIRAFQVNEYTPRAPEALANRTLAKFGKKQEQKSTTTSVLWQATMLRTRCPIGLKANCGGESKSLTVKRR